MDNYPLNKFYSAIYRRYDLVNRVFTLWNDRYWRRDTVKYCLNEEPVEILDVCCGTGDLAIELRREAGESVRVTGYDFSKEMLDVAKEKIKKEKLKIEWVQGDVANMNFSDGKFDAITIGFGFRNLTYQNSNAQKHLGELYRVLKKGGNLYILESGKPSNRIIRFFFNIYLKLFLIPIGGILSGNWAAYRYLAKSSSEFFNLDEVKKVLIQSGFEFRFAKKYFMGASNLVVAGKK